MESGRVAGGAQGQRAWKRVGGTGKNSEGEQHGGWRRVAGLGWQPFCPRCWPSSEGRSLLARGRGHLPEEGRDSQHFEGGPGDGRCDGTHVPGLGCQHGFAA